MLHPDTIRPETSLGHLSSPPPALEDIGTATAMSIVILRNAGEQRGTTIEDFREAPETCHLTDDQVAANIGRARRIADARVIRQDSSGWPNGSTPEPVGQSVDESLPTYVREAGDVHGIREATAEDDLAEATDEALLTLAEQSCAQIVTDDAIVGALLQQGFRPSAISRIWDRLTARLSADVAALGKPTIGHIAARAAMANRKAVV